MALQKCGRCNLGTILVDAYGESVCSLCSRSADSGVDKSVGEVVAVAAISTTLDGEIMTDDDNNLTHWEDRIESRVYNLRASYKDEWFSVRLETLRERAERGKFVCEIAQSVEVVRRDGLPTRSRLGLQKLIRRALKASGVSVRVRHLDAAVDLLLEAMPEPVEKQNIEMRRSA